MKGNVVFSDGLTIDFLKRSITCNNKNISLAKKEFDIVELLVKHAGEILDKDQIYESVWGKSGKGSSSVVSEHIRRIRTKIGICTDTNHIETIWRIGYKWVKEDVKCLK